MQTNFTFAKFGSYCKKVLAIAAIFTVFTQTVQAQTLLINEDFATVPPTGWTINNRSTPAGALTWQNGVATNWAAFDGAATSYAFVNYNTVTGDNTISNWLISPTVTIKNGDIVSFYTRTYTGSGFADRLEARMSTNGASVNVGTTNTSIGDFTILLNTVNSALTVGGYPETWTQFTATVSGVTGTVTGRIAYRYFVTNGGPAGANSNGIGIDRVVYNSIATAACAGTPAPGATISTAPSVCPNVPFTLSVANATPGTGVTYQFQSGPSATGPFTNIAGATASTYTVNTLAATTFYQLLVTCGGVTTASTPVQVAATPTSGCYCIPPAGTATTACNDGDQITNVTVGGINNSSGCSNAGPGGVQGYSNYTTTVAPGIIYRGAANPISVTPLNGGFTEYVGVWVDYDQSGTFDPSEFTLIGSTATGATLSGNLVVPATAILGTTRMRVRLNFNTAPSNNSACTAPPYGETEDYNVTITACVPVTITGQPANASVVCGTNATFTVTTAGSLPAYQWEYRTSPTGPWLVVPNAAPYSGVNTATLTVAATAAQNGYQYRAVVTGACSGPDVSNAATLTVTPITLAITPASITKCASAAPVLIATPSTQTVLNFTNNTPGAVADGDLAGITRTVTVAGVAGPVQKVRVKINATSNYIGDLVIALKAPNGKIINLDYLLNLTNNGPSTGSGFVNTFFNLNRTVRNYPAYNVPAAQAIDQFNAPYTGDFPIDNQQATYYVGVPSGPTGFAANTTDPTSLYPTAASANGVWTLAMYDAGPPDPAVFQNFTLEITYGGAPATAVFTPSAGLYTNAAGTTPYTGGAVTQVYANPAANTTYTAVISSGACTGNPQTIQVNVNSPVGGTATLANTTICAGTNATFALGGTLTGGPGYTHNFQVSTNNGVSYTNITNGGVYGGANTNTLTLTNVPYSYNGYKFRDSINTPGSCGALISTAATLTVNPTPVVTISASPITNIYPGLTSTLTAAVSSATAPISYQWYLNGVAVPGATANMYVVGVDHEGTYTVKVTDANGCSAAAGTSTPGSLTIGDSTGVTILFIYPSPNSGRFQVRYYNDINNGGTAPAFVNVYDSRGSRVFTRRYTLGAGYQAMNVDMGNHAKGLYRVELVDLNGNRIKTGSVMVF